MKNVAPAVTIIPQGPTTIAPGGTFQLRLTFTDPSSVDNPWTITLLWGNGKVTQTSATRLTNALRSR
ncbi:MAG: hypothetical protein ABI836_15060, partial [Gemmatimonadota bacterium]